MGLKVFMKFDSRLTKAYMFKLIAKNGTLRVRLKLSSFLSQLFEDHHLDRVTFLKSFFRKCLISNVLEGTTKMYYTKKAVKFTSARLSESTLLTSADGESSHIYLK